MKADQLGYSDFRWCIVCAHKEAVLTPAVIVMAMGNLSTMKTQEQSYCQPHGEWIISEFKKGSLAFNDDDKRRMLHADEALVKWVDTVAYFV